MEKVKEVLHKVTPGHSDKSSTTTTGTGTGSTTHTGPYSSGIANQADPRVDSDHDASRNMGATQTHGTGSTGLTGSSTGTHTGTTGTTGSVPVTKPGAHSGPHSSGLANQLDPRVDSDHDASRNMGATQTHGTGSTGLTGSSGTHTGTGLTGSHGTTGHTGTTHTGPHSSGLANQADPRIDSDRDASRNMGATQTHGTTGLTGSSGTHTGTTGAHTGPHSSGMANQADPRVDSDLDGSRNLGASGTTGTTTGTTGAGYGTTGTGAHGTHGTTTGPASTTAGPHSSNIANKLDPRVDSDRDGSKTVGGNM